MPQQPMLRRLLSSAAAVLTLGLAGCLDSSGPKQITPTDPATVTYASTLGVDLATMTKTGSGLYYRDVTVGTGAAATVGSTVTTTYAGYFPDGSRFDAGTAVKFDLQDVVPGFREGVAGMRVGGKRKLVIRPLLGYGLADRRDPRTGQVVIPGNSVLVFDVELVSVP